MRRVNYKSNRGRSTYSPTRSAPSRMHRSHAARTMQAAFRGMQGRRRATGIRATRAMSRRVPGGVRRRINSYLNY